MERIYGESKYDNSFIARQISRQAEFAAACFILSGIDNNPILITEAENILEIKDLTESISLPEAANFLWEFSGNMYISLTKEPDKIILVELTSKSRSLKNDRSE